VAWEQVRVLASRSLKSVSVFDCDCNAGKLDPLNSTLITATLLIFLKYSSSHIPVLYDEKHIKRGGGGGVRRSVGGFAKS